MEELGFSNERGGVVGDGRCLTVASGREAHEEHCPEAIVLKLVCRIEARCGGV